MFARTALMLIASLLVYVPGFAQSQQPVLETVPFVEVSKYLGRWYQIQRNVLPFEPANCVCAQQTLSVLPSGLVGVYNSCRVGTPDGALREISGTATNDDPNSNSRFTVDFGLGYTGQYWIIGIADDYRYAIVSDPKRYSLYILSKTPTLSEADLLEATSMAARQVPTDKLVSTDQTNCQYPN
jgi:apolipoprotein D and lipocalin family protein